MKLSTWLPIQRARRADPSRRAEGAPHKSGQNKGHGHIVLSIKRNIFHKMKFLVPFLFCFGAFLMLSQAVVVNNPASIQSSSAEHPRMNPSRHKTIDDEDVFNTDSTFRFLLRILLTPFTILTPESRMQQHPLKVTFNTKNATDVHHKPTTHDPAVYFVIRATYFYLNRLIFSPTYRDVLGLLEALSHYTNVGPTYDPLIRQYIAYVVKYSYKQ
ncbi:hypothetical protein TNCV_1843071 [Trichonephila clavipes]|nr:hypothetical protein TNCV_1843071 [Trichonephila clavipes]